MRSWRIGILGAGYIADWHVKALRSVPGAQTAAVCDQNLGRARSFADRHGIAGAFPDIESMLAAGPLDAVHVLLPPDLHFTTAKQLLEAGVHVFIEKPACITALDCVRLAELAEIKDKTVGVGHNFLFAPIYERMRHDVRSGRLGPISEVSIVWNKELGYFRSGPYGAWLLREPGNVMVEIGPHSVAQVLDLVGLPDRLTAEGDRPIELPNGVTIPRRWRVDCARGEKHIELRFDMGTGYQEHRIHVRGLAGSATADFEAGTYVVRRPGEGMIDFVRYRITADEGRELRRQAHRKLRRYVLSKFKLTRQGNDFGVGIARALQSFYANLGNRTDARMTLDFSASVVAMCSRIAEAAGMSIGKGQRVERPPIEPIAAPSVLVLGGTGFMGQDLVRKLVEAGHGVRLLARDPRYLPRTLHGLQIEVVGGDLSKPEDLDRAMHGIRTVMHLARSHVKTWPEYERFEIGATRNVAEACLRTGVERLIYTGTIDSLYTGARSQMIDESVPTDRKAHRRNLYARAKAESEKLLQDLRNERGLLVSILRPGIVLGSGGGPFHWGIGLWHGCTVCRLWGRGDTPLPIVLVEDVSRALVCAVDADGVVGEVFNLVGEPLLTGREYIAELEKAAGLKIDMLPTSAWRFYRGDLYKWLVKVLVRHPDRRRPSYRDWQTRAHLARFDCTKAKRILGWVPTTDRDTIIREGIVKPVREWLA